MGAGSSAGAGCCLTPEAVWLPLPKTDSEGDLVAYGRNGREAAVDRSGVEPAAVVIMHDRRPRLRVWAAELRTTARVPPSLHTRHLTGVVAERPRQDERVMLAALRGRSADGTGIGTVRPCSPSARGRRSDSRRVLARVYGEVTVLCSEADT